MKETEQTLLDQIKEQVAKEKCKRPFNHLSGQDLRQCIDAICERYYQARLTMPGHEAQENKPEYLKDKVVFDGARTDSDTPMSFTESAYKEFETAGTVTSLEPKTIVTMKTVESKENKEVTNKEEQELLIVNEAINKHRWESDFKEFEGKDLHIVTPESPEPQEKGHDCEFFLVTDVSVYACECDPHHILIDNQEYVAINKITKANPVSAPSESQEEQEELWKEARHYIDVWRIEELFKRFTIRRNGDKD